MATQIFKFGDHDFSEDVDSWGESVPQQIASSLIPHRPGALASEGTPATKRVTIRGTLQAVSPAALRALEDQTLNSFRNTTGNETGPVNKLRVWDDRYVDAQLDNWQRDFVPGAGMVALTYAATFQASDPYWKSDVLSSETTSPVTSSYTFTVAAHGSAPSPPSAIRVTATRGIKSGMRLANLTENKYWEFDAYLATGDVLTVDCEQLAVTLNGVTALTSFAGDFWSLEPTTNQLRYDANNTAGQLTIEWRDRYH